METKEKNTAENTVKEIMTYNTQEMERMLQTNIEKVIEKLHEIAKEKRVDIVITYENRWGKEAGIKITPDLIEYEWQPEMIMKIDPRDKKSMKIKDWDTDPREVIYILFLIKEMTKIKIIPRSIQK